MSALCEIKGNEVFTTSLKIAEGTGVEHRAIMQLLKTHSGRKTLSTFEMSKVSRGGRPVEFAMLNEIQTTFLITLMRNSDIVVEFKEKLTQEFFRQRETIAQLVRQQKDPNWQNVRSDGKHVYLQKTDIIKQFVNYAKAQGSTSAERYYSNLATMENKALFFIESKYKNMREIMTIKQLMQIATADQVVEKAIQEGMDQELHYKDIYQLAKERVIAFANIIGKSHLHDLALESTPAK